MNGITHWQISNSPSTILNTLKTNVLADGGTYEDVLVRNEYLDLHTTIKKQASLVVAGGMYKTGTVYGFNPQTSALIPFTFTRANNTATRVNKDGLVETVAADVPRMDYDPVTKQFKGLLMEKGSTNLHTFSEDFTNAAWTKNSVTVTSTSEVSSIYGVAFKATEFADATPKFVLQNISLTIGQTYTAWRVFKAKERGVIRAQLYSMSAIAQADFNLVAGTVIQTIGTATIEHLGDGWYKCSITGMAANTASHAVRFYPVVGGDPSYEGDGVSAYYIAVAQLEQSAYPTSYIPTQGSSVTRGAESCSAAVGSWYTAGNNCMWAKATKDQVNPMSSFSYVARMSPSSGNGFISVYDLETAISSENKNSSNVNDLTIGSTMISTGSVYKMSFLCNLNDGAFYYNNTLGGTDNTLTPITVSTLLLGGSQGGGSIGHLNGFAYFPTRISNTELQAITK